MSILTNILNIFIAPSKVFEVVKDFEWKKALVPMLILALLGIIVFWVVKDLARDVEYNKVVETIENSSRIPEESKEEQIAVAEQRMEKFGFLGWIFSAIGGPIAVFFMALVALIVGNSFMGGSAKYGQLLNVTAWSFMVNILESIVKIPIMLKKWSFDVFTGLGVLGIGEKGSFINSFLNGIDIFAIWRVILIAVGMGIIYNKNTRPYAIAMLAAWLVLRLIAAGFSSFFGGFAG